MRLAVEYRLIGEPSRDSSTSVGSLTTHTSLLPVARGPCRRVVRRFQNLTDRCRAGVSADTAATMTRTATVTMYGTERTFCPKSKSDMSTKDVPEESTSRPCNGDDPACSDGDAAVSSGPRGLAAAGDLKLAEDRRDVVVGGLRRDVEAGGDLGVREVLFEQGEHLELAGREPDGVVQRRRTPAARDVRHASVAKLLTQPSRDRVGADAVEDVEAASHRIRVLGLHQRDCLVEHRVEALPLGGRLRMAGGELETVWQRRLEVVGRKVGVEAAQPDGQVSAGPLEPDPVESAQERRGLVDARV